MAKLYVGLDVSNLTTAICIVDGRGSVVLESTSDTSPTGIVAALQPHRKSVVAVGLEAGVLAGWLTKGLAEHGYAVTCLDTAHAHGVLRVERHKTDRNDARGLARLMRTGWVKSAHIRSPEATRLRFALVLRASMVRKAVDLEHLLRQCVKVFGIQVGRGPRDAFEERLRVAIGGDPLLKTLVGGVLRSRALLMKECDKLSRRLEHRARSDEVCSRLMTVPGVGPYTALMFRACVDDPARFRRSDAVGVYFGLTPRRRQSGEKDGFGSISKLGDVYMRTLLCTSAMALLRSKGDSNIQKWGRALARRKKPGVAKVAVARKLATVLHRIWISGEQFNGRRGASAGSAPTVAESSM